MPVKRDPYVEFTRRFFRRWVGAYDLFAASIAFAYRAAVRTIAPTAGQRVLDLCTGTGEVGTRCARRGARVTGVDLTLEMLDRAARKSRGLPFEPCLMDARCLAFAPDTFDTVCLSFALHDMPSAVRLEVLAEARRVGRKRLVVVDYELPQSRWLRGLVAWLVGLFETPYFKSFVRQRPEELLAAAGLRRVRRSSLFPGLIALFAVDLTGEVPPS
jgi:demethylmenaquinone methyltransferase/2-methoxy-6-polyprenyl-1,4-benzoquinol methylase